MMLFILSNKIFGGSNLLSKSGSKLMSRNGSLYFSSHNIQYDCEKVVGGTQKGILLEMRKIWEGIFYENGHYVF